MADARTVRVAIVGAGPRGTSVLERLLARVAATPEQLPALVIDLIDPFPAGPGHVWRTDQSRLYLMNTQSFYPTLVPGGELPAASLTKLSFDEWRVAQRAAPDESLSEQDAAELTTLESTGFPSRALYGRYLRWTFEQLTAQLPAGVTLREHRSEATAIRPTAAGEDAVDPSVRSEATAIRPTAAGGYAVDLADGRRLVADRVVLALGHLPSRLGREQELLAAGAAKAGLRYWPPAVPNDVDWDALPAGQPVLVRGMGLNFFDVLGQLTEGRGGNFVETGLPAGEALRYEPSGREPLIAAASRRGTPYRAKAELESYYPRSVRLRFLTPEAVRALTASGLEKPGFDHDLWPLMHRDALWAYYSTLARVRPGATRPDAVDSGAGTPGAIRPDAVDSCAVAASAFLHRLEQTLLEPGPDWRGRLDAVLAASVAPADRLNLEALARPFAARHFSGHQDFADAVHAYLQADARGSAAGEDDPLKMAIGALNAGRAVIKSVVCDGGITDESWLGELRGWFESFVEGLASGPPALRMEQLAALVRDGVVRFIGPDPVFGLDPERRVFTASSPWVDAPPWRAKDLIEALAPANRVLQSSSPLLEQLLADGLVRPRIMLAADGEPVATSGLDLSAPPYRALDSAGRIERGLHVLGLQLSSVQWGTAIAAQAASDYPSGYRTLQDADSIAADVLGAAGS
ncbi:MAG: FAD/NAD(P)-binding protein [Actinomycetota bacterium]|nr:FAD/NAD(P)-binding protein [Actinomycetota bacterium]